MTLAYVPEPTEDGPYIPFLRRVNEPGETLECVILGISIHWIHTHFNLRRNRTELCEASRDDEGNAVDPSDCSLCLDNAPTRIKGYLHVWNVKKRREEFLEVTPKAWQYTRHQWPVVPVLRGWRLTVVRGRGRTAALSLVLSEPSVAQDPNKLPPCKLPEQSLRHAMR